MQSLGTIKDRNGMDLTEVLDLTSYDSTITAIVFDIACFKKCCSLHSQVCD